MGYKIKLAKKQHDLFNNTLITSFAINMDKPPRSGHSVYNIFIHRLRYLLMFFIALILLQYLALNIINPDKNQISHHQLTNLVKTNENMESFASELLFVLKKGFSQVKKTNRLVKFSNFSNHHDQLDTGIIVDNEPIYQSLYYFKFIAASVKGRFFILKKIIFSQKTFFLKQIISHFSSNQVGLLDGVLFGNTDFISEKTRHLLKVTGMQHVVSASGYNVSLVAMMIVLLVEKLGGSRWVKTSALIIGISWYVTISGASAPLLRAALMAYVSLLTQVVGKQYRAWWGLGVVAATMIFFNRQYLSSISFQLSIAATFGLVNLMPSFITQSGAITSLSQNDFSSIQQQSFKIIDLFKESFFISLSAQIFTGPLVVWYFQEFSLLSLPANTFLVWLVSFVTIGGVIFLIGVSLLLLFPFLLPIIFLLAQVIKFIIELFFLGLDWFGQYESSLLSLKIKLWQLISWYVLVLLWVFIRQKQKHKWQKLTY